MFRFLDRHDFIAFLTGAFLVVTLIFFSMCGAVKLIQVWFPGDGKPDLTQQSLDMCRSVHGTPVLESNGEAYKSCAINGKSQTGNYVSHEQ